LTIQTNRKKLKYFSHIQHSAQSNETTDPGIMTSRAALFQKSTRKNTEFERYLCDGQEPAVLDATTSKYIPLSYFVTPHTQAAAAPAPASTPRRTSSRNTHGLADHMPFESFRLINLQQRGNHAHSLVLFKSRAITTNPEQIAIFECNGQLQQSEIRVIHTSPPPKEYTDDSDSDSDSSEAEDESGTVYDVTQLYFSPISPKVCLNYGNDKYNPGYCGMFGMMAMVFFRGGFRRGFRPPTTVATLDRPGGLRPETTPGGVRPETTVAPLDKGAGDAKGTRWIKKWTLLLKYMRQEIPDEPECHGCMGTNLAAQVQEIIAAHPSTATGHQQAEAEIIRILKQVLHTTKNKRNNE
jgi:hypothetical protein